MRVNIHHQRDEEGGERADKSSCSLLLVQFDVFLFFCGYADDRLVSILRHHSFLKELQEIALRGESLSAEDAFALIGGGSSGLLFILLLGGREGAEQDGGEDVTMQASETVSDIPGEPYTLMHSPCKHCFYPEVTKRHQDTWSVTQIT